MNLMTVRTQLDQEYAALSVQELDELKGRAEIKQHAKEFVPKQTKCAQQHDIIQVANGFQLAVSAGHLDYLRSGANNFKLNALNARTGHFGICILVRSNRSMNADPLVLKTGDIDQFFEDITNKTMLHLVEDLDVWLTTRHLRGKLLDFLFMICTYLISTGLATVKKGIQECKKYCRNELRANLR